MNIIVQAKAGAAYLLIDTAAYTPDGMVELSTRRCLRWQSARSRSRQSRLPACLPNRHGGAG